MVGTLTSSEEAGRMRRGDVEASGIGTRILGVWGRTVLENPVWRDQLGCEQTVCVPFRARVIRDDKAVHKFKCPNTDIIVVRQMNSMSGVFTCINLRAADQTVPYPSMTPWELNLFLSYQALPYPVSQQWYPYLKGQAQLTAPPQPPGIRTLRISESYSFCYS